MPSQWYTRIQLLPLGMKTKNNEKKETQPIGGPMGPG